MADRVEGRPDTRSEFILDRAIRRAVDRERHKNSMADRCNERIEAAIPRITARIEQALQGGPRGFRAARGTGSSRLARAFAVVDQIVAEEMAKIRAECEAEMMDLARQEDDRLRGILILAGLSGGAVLAAKRLREIIRERPMGAVGETFPERLTQLEAQWKRDIKTTTRVGVAQAETAEQIAGRLRDVGQRVTKRVEGAVRTGLAHVSAQVAQERAQPSVVVDRVQWVATLDAATCVRCAALDGQVFDVGVGPRPPLHDNCRCEVVTLVRGDDAPNILTYSDWLRTKSAGLQDDILGKAKGKMFRQGRLDVSRFVNDRQKVLNLKQMREREPDAFKAAGLDS